MLAKSVIVLALASVITALAGAADLSPFEKLSPAELPAPPKDVTNRYSDDPHAASLGARWFHDPGFSGRLLEGDNDGSRSALGRRGEVGKVACSGCHIPSSAFTDTRSAGQAVSLAAGWGSRKAPSLLDVAQNKLLMWDGRRDALYNQVFGVIESPVEMNSSRLFVAQELARRYRAEYEMVFGPMPRFEDPKVFPQLAPNRNGCAPRMGVPHAVCDGVSHGTPGDHHEYDSLSAKQKDQVNRAVVNFGKAIAAYERSLRCGPGRFDRWVHGDETALSDGEKRGAALFVGKAKCITCHSGPYFSDFKFHVVGLQPHTVALVVADYGDRGAAQGLKDALKDPLNSRGRYSDGYDGRLPASIPGYYLGAMKTPMLRCVSRRPSFMHTGQIHGLREVVEFFDRGGDHYSFFSPNEISPLGLTSDEKGDLASFLQALDGSAR